MSFNYYYDRSSIKGDRLQFLWEFSEVAGVIASDTSPGAAHPGIASNVGMLHNGSGNFFNGEYIEVSGAINQISTDQFTAILGMRKGFRGSNAILVSATGATSATGGFTIGSDYGNRIFVEVYGDTVQTRTFSKTNLAQQNIFAIRKSNRDFTLTCYDPVSDLTESETVSFDQGTNFGKFPMYVGHNPLSSASDAYTPLTGEIGQIAYIDRSINDSGLVNLFRGFKSYSSEPSLAPLVTGLAQQTRYVSHPSYYVGQESNISSINGFLFGAVSSVAGRPRFDWHYSGHFDSLSSMNSGEGGSFDVGEWEYTPASYLSFTGALPDLQDVSKTGLYTGVIRAHFDAHGNLTTTNEMHYTDVVGSVEMAVYDDQYQRSATGYSGGVSVITGDYHQYAMESFATISLETGTTQLAVRATNYLYNPHDRNRVARVVNYPESLIANTGDDGFLDLYDTSGRLVNSSYYSVNGNVLTFPLVDLDLDGQYLYDRNVSYSSQTTGAALNLVPYEHIWRGGSTIFGVKGGGAYRLDLRGGQYVETSQVDLFESGSIQSLDVLGIISYSAEPVLTGILQTVWE